MAECAADTSVEISHNPIDFKSTLRLQRGSIDLWSRRPPLPRYLKKYQDPTYFPIAAAAKKKQRDHAAKGTWCIGQWIIDTGEIVFEGIQQDPAYHIDETAPLTRKLRCLARWSTKQGCNQWLIEHRRHTIWRDKLHPLRTLNLRRLFGANAPPARS